MQRVWFNVYFSPDTLTIYEFLAVQIRNTDRHSIVFRGRRGG